MTIINAGPDKDEAHKARVRSLGCIVCVILHLGRTPAQFHHVRTKKDMRRDNYRGIPLCGYHHLDGPPGHAVHNGKKSFEAKFGTQEELLIKTEELLASLE